MAGDTTTETKKASHSCEWLAFEWRGQDLNLRPRGYEPRELPGCSTPRQGAPLLGGREYIGRLREGK